jgi:hypothetical protein
MIGTVIRGWVGLAREFRCRRRGRWNRKWAPGYGWTCRACSRPLRWVAGAYRHNDLAEVITGLSAHG